MPPWQRENTRRASPLRIPYRSGVRAAETVTALSRLLAVCRLDRRGFPKIGATPGLPPPAGGRTISLGGTDWNETSDIDNPFRDSFCIPRERRARLERSLVPFERGCYYDGPTGPVALPTRLYAAAGQRMAECSVWGSPRGCAPWCRGGYAALAIPTGGRLSIFAATGWATRPTSFAAHKSRSP